MCRNIGTIFFSFFQIHVGGTQKSHPSHLDCFSDIEHDLVKIVEILFLLCILIWNLVP